VAVSPDDVAADHAALLLVVSVVGAVGVARHSPRAARHIATGQTLSGAASDRAVVGRAALTDLAGGRVRASVQGGVRMAEDGTRLRPHPLGPQHHSRTTEVPSWLPLPYPALGSDVREARVFRLDQAGSGSGVWCRASQGGGGRHGNRRQRGEARCQAPRARHDPNERP
jgi:hypothetical protein